MIPSQGAAFFLLKGIIAECLGGILRYTGTELRPSLWCYHEDWMRLGVTFFLWFHIELTSSPTHLVVTCHPIPSFEKSRLNPIEFI